MANEPKKSGMTLPNVRPGIFEPTTQPEAPAVEPVAEQGGEPAPKATRTRAKKAAPADAEKVEGWKLYLTEDVRFRLRMLAFKRGQKLSTVANEVLDKALPRWELKRAE